MANDDDSKTPSTNPATEPGKVDYLEETDSDFDFTEMGEWLFQWRDYTPLPFVVLLLFVAEPSARSAAVGTLLVVLGELIRIYAVAFIGCASRTRSDSLGGKLVTNGPFQWVRNPIYLGNFFITLGLTLFGGVEWIIVLTMLAFGFQYYCIIQYEERLLSDKFGDEFRQYASKVPQWIPSGFSNITDWQWPETFTPAINSEKRTLMAIGLMILALMIVS